MLALAALLRHKERMRACTWMACAAVAANGCSQTLDYDAVRFGADAGGSAGVGGESVDASAGSGGTAGSGGAKDSSAAGAEAAPTDAKPGEPAPDPCVGVLCSGHGTCQPGEGGKAECKCDPGYHTVGMNCEPDPTCSGMQCGRCATCEIVGGIASCTCPAQFKPDGSNGCVVDPNPCDTTTCGADEYCVPEAHCAPLGACVPTCDCSNCPNCGPDNSDGKWNDWQEYCGNLNQSPATMACTKPCPNGEGCLPYATQICWPMEGCISL